MDNKTLLVTGSRSLDHAKGRARVFAELDRIAGNAPPARLIHGGAKGVDIFAGEWAIARSIPVTVVRPDFKTWPIDRYRWKAYGERDKAMVDQADVVVAIWDGESKGTQLTFEYAENKGKLQQIVFVK